MAACALCHSATWRDAEDGKRHIVPTGPSSTFDSLSYLRFLSAWRADPRFNAENLLYEIQYNVDVKMSWLDRVLYRYVIIPQTKKGLLAQSERYAWTYAGNRPVWGPGRIDPSNSVKFHQLEMDVDDTIGNADMMPIWDLARRKKMAQGDSHFHWDGLNTETAEVIHSSALGGGATNKSLLVKQLARIQEFASNFRPPSNPFGGDVGDAKLRRGAEIFAESCWECHAAKGPRTATVISYSEVGTEHLRADMWTQAAADRYNRYSEGYAWDFDNFQNTDGYLAVPLDGLWLRGPYLHNGSVPTVRDLLLPPEQRPRSFYRGYDVLDPSSIGFVSGMDSNARHTGFLFDTTQPGSGNQGHTYGTELEPDDKAALLESLKTL